MNMLVLIMLLLTNLEYSQVFQEEEMVVTSQTGSPFIMKSCFHFKKL